MTRAYTKGGRVAVVGALTLFGVAWLESSGIAAPRASAAAPTFAVDVKPQIVKYCIGCHSGKEAEAGLDLSQYLTANAALGNMTVLRKVAERLSKQQMPPAGSPAPGETARTGMVQWLDNAVASECKVADPGHVTIRRLNREEYNNSIRDLTGLDLHPADDFPSDDVGYGFDNIGDVLSLSPLLMEKYLTAAEKVAQAVIQVSPVRTRHIDPDQMSAGQNSTQSDQGFREIYSNGEITKDVALTIPGRYKVRILAGGDLAGKELPKMQVSWDGKPVASFDVGVRHPATTLYEAPLDLESGKHKLGVAFTNDYFNTKDPPGQQDRNLYVHYVELIGPIDAKAPTTPAYLHVIPTQPTRDTVEDDARRDLKSFATRAFRRPVTTDELDRLVKLFDIGMKSGSFDEGMQVGMEAVLSSPSFLFRVELDPRDQNGAVRPLNDYEIASRLSYFLWSSTPDDELLELATEGKLRKPAILHAQIKRMLEDSKSEALANNFAGQWLQLRKLAIVEPDPQRFPGVDDTLKQDMATETKMFFDSILREDRPISDFIDARYTFVNERLAKLYGMPGVTGPAFRKVDVEEPRGGVLTQASILTVTSNPTRTSPTKRGKWVLEQILNAPLPPPPPGVSVINGEQHLLQAQSLRQLMEEHRKNPTCAACHSKMDPIGFGLENFDAVGRWRTKDGDFALDTKGILPDGRSFSGPSELKAILLADKEQFARALTEKLLTYALGRGTEPADSCAIDDIVKKTAAGGYRFQSLIAGVVDSDPFQKTRKGTAQ